jgi:hypothetical protein
VRANLLKIENARITHLSNLCDNADIQLFTTGMTRVYHLFILPIEHTVHTVHICNRKHKRIIPFHSSAMKEYQFEKVTFIPSPLTNGECIPKITIGDQEARDFQPEDMSRVMDYENMPPPPPDAPHGHLEFEMDDDATVSDDAPPKFPKRYFCLRGNFIFYYDMEDVDSSYNRYGAKFNAAPLGVIPLERTKVEFPQGGRRVFREHSKTEARSGYEMMIRHVPRAGAGLTNANDGDGTSVVGGGAGGGTATATGVKSGKRRAPAYLVCDSSGQRDLWKKAIEVRSEMFQKPTKLRAAGTNANVSKIARAEGGSRSPDHGAGNRKTSRRVGGEISVLAGVIETEEQKDIDEALEQFGSKTLFDDADWVNEYFESHDQVEGSEMCTKLERWQTSIKKGLRGGKSYFLDL